MSRSSGRCKKLGKRIYNWLTYYHDPDDPTTGADIAEYWTWNLVEKTGWTLEYIDALPIERIHNWMLIRDAEAKAKETHGK